MMDKKKKPTNEELIDEWYEKGKNKAVQRLQKDIKSGVDEKKRELSYLKELQRLRDKYQYLHKRRLKFLLLKLKYIDPVIIKLNPLWHAFRNMRNGMVRSIIWIKGFYTRAKLYILEPLAKYHKVLDLILNLFLKIMEGLFFILFNLPKKLLYKIYFSFWNFITASRKSDHSMPISIETIGLVMEKSIEDEFEKEIVSVEDYDNISMLLSQMVSTESNFAVLKRHNYFHGCITSYSIVKNFMFEKVTKEKAWANQFREANIPVLKVSDTIEDAFGLFLDKKSWFMVIVRKNKAIGLYSLKQLVFQFEQFLRTVPPEVLNKFSVEDFMLKGDDSFIEVDQNEKLSEIQKKIAMTKEKICLGMHKGVPIGIITNYDIIREISNKGKDVKDLTAADIMSMPVVTVDLSFSIYDVLRTMVSTNMKRLVVVKKGLFVGIISVFDILKAISEIIEELNSKG